MNVVRSVEIRGTCPYCKFIFAAWITNICGEQQALTCYDCREIFVVVAKVAPIDLIVQPLKNVDVAAVMDRLTTRKKPLESEPEPAATLTFAEVE